MAKISYIHTDKAPHAVGPYSQAVKTGNFVFCWGQIALDPKSGEIVGKNITEQTDRVIKNLSEVLEVSDSSLKKVVKVTVYLTNIEDYTEFNSAYEKYFRKNKPARCTVEVSNLPKHVLVEIDAIAQVA